MHIASSASLFSNAISWKAAHLGFRLTATQLQLQLLLARPTLTPIRRRLEPTITRSSLLLSKIAHIAIPRFKRGAHIGCLISSPNFLGI